jgi:hypothetical protein
VAAFIGAMAFNCLVGWPGDEPLPIVETHCENFGLDDKGMTINLHGGKVAE